MQIRGVVNIIYADMFTPKRAVQLLKACKTAIFLAVLF